MYHQDLYVSSRFRSSNLKNIGSECALNALLFLNALLLNVKGTVSIISSNPSYKDSNDRFTTLKPLSHQIFEK